MMLKAGTFLKSSSTMEDEKFTGTILFITEYNEQGAMAFVINKKSERCLNGLVEFSSSPAFPLYEGGPVEQDHLYFIHRCNHLIDRGELITKDVYLGGNFKQAVSFINNKQVTTNDIKIFIGYCGWDKDELEAEMAEGNWLIIEDDEYKELLWQ